MVIWTTHASSQLRNIHHYIAQNSVIYAKRTVLDITNKIKILDDFPQIGKVVPEIQQDHIRELSIHSYRLLYQIDHSNIYVLAIVHKGQILDKTNLSED